MSDERMFPIQRGTPIPWHEAEKAYRTYAEHYGESQSLERLAQRGGFGVSEFACLYNGHRPKKHEDGNYCPFPDFESTKLKVEIAALRAGLATANARIAALEAERMAAAAAIEAADSTLCACRHTPNHDRAAIDAARAAKAGE